ncbi:MAG: peptidoglycan-binding protein [Clostridia bacterium]|nr:peptidoglycan-binding protein [Clostridia bacterium]
MVNIAYSTISYGSSGADVRKLQETLNQYGYSLDVDGQFGSATRQAVMEYQKNNGLTADGIVGSNTWGSLNSRSGNTTAVGNNSGSSGNRNSSSRPEYEKSDAVISAENALNDWENNKPVEYQSQYAEQIDAILNDILNREEFSYNMNADPLYQQYKEQYIQNGKKAMMDTVGQASALTGGYANSYATTAGNQAYDEYLNELNYIGLDLRDRAYEQYQDEGDKMIADITLLRGLDGDDYEKYLGELEKYYADGEYLLNKLVSMSDAEFEAFLAEVAAWENDRDFAFRQHQDELDRQEFEREMAFRQAEVERAQANADREYALALQKLEQSASSGSSKKDEKDEKGSSTKNVPVTYGEFCSRTGVYSILTESEFYSSKLAGEMYSTYQEYLAAMYKEYA